MIGKSADPSDFLARKKRAIILQTQQSKGKYVQIENKSMGFDNGVLQVFGTHGLDTYLPKPRLPVCIGTYTSDPNYNQYSPLTITNTGYTYTSGTPSVPPYSIYAGMNIQDIRGIIAQYVLLVNCTGNILYFSVDNGLTKNIINPNFFVAMSSVFPHGILISS